MEDAELFPWYYPAHSSVRAGDSAEGQSRFGLNYKVEPIFRIGIEIHSSVIEAIRSLIFYRPTNRL
jgi:hypothetical protein